MNFKEIVKKYTNKPCPLCTSLVSTNAFSSVISCENYHKITKYTCFSAEIDVIQMLFGDILILIIATNEMYASLKIMNVGKLGSDIQLLDLKINISELEPTFPFIDKIISQDRIRTLDLFQ